MRYPLSVLSPALLLVLLCPVWPASAAVADCARTVTPAEKAVCASPRLLALEEEVAVAAQRLAGSLPAPWDEVVRKSQREWLHTRGLDAAELRGKALDEALRGSLQRRIEALNGAVIARNRVRLLSIDRAVVQKVAPERLEDARGRRQVVQHAAPLYLLDEQGAAQPFNALIDTLVGPMLDPDRAADGEYSMSASLNFVSPDLLAVGIVTSSFGLGAAHPVEGARQINFLPAQGRLLVAEDLFAGHDYERLIQRRAAQAFADAGLKPLAGGQEARALLLNPQNWVLDARGLTVVVPPDTLFAHADGSPEVPTLLWKDLQPGLTPFAQRVFLK